MRTLALEVHGLPHCPRNRSHAIFKKGKANFLGKTEAAHSYEKALLFHLEKFKTSAATFCASFNPKTQYLTALWMFRSPDVYTKDGAVSRNSVDLDAHKVLQDTVMRFVGIDDAYIMRDTREKGQGEYSVYVLLAIHDKEVIGEDLL